MNSPNALEQLQYESRELFGVLSSQFTGEFEPVNHCSELSMPLPRFHPFYGTYPHLLKQAPASVEIRYIPGIDCLDFASVRLPRQDRTNMLLKRAFSRPGVFFPFFETEDRKNEKPIINDKGQTFLLSQEHITEAMEIADIRMPKLFITPEDYRQGIAELRSNSKSWTSTDRRIIPYAPLRTLTFEQKLAEYVPNATTELMQADYVPSRGRTTSHKPFRRINPESSPTSLTLTAINEVIETSGIRRQVVITFAGTSHEISRPMIYGRKLQPDMLLEAFDIKDADPRNATYTVTEYYDPLKACGQNNVTRQLELVRNMADVVVKALLF